jgi:Holliday junction resolvase RusA-like endonuclease
MGQTLSIFVDGDPIQKNRPRFARKTMKSKKTGKMIDFVQTYSDQETEEGLWIMKVREIVRKRGVFFKGAIEITFRFWVKRPAGHYGTGRNAGILKANAPKWPEWNQDLDNYEKFAMDCLNHCNVWEDDCHVVGLNSKKRYVVGSNRPMTEIFITEDIRD